MSINHPKKESIFSIDTEHTFEQLALEVFRFQAAHCTVYRDFLSYLSIQSKSITATTQIPFLPIECFKVHPVLSTDQKIAHTFYSSGTTQDKLSKHLVTDISWYEHSFRDGFEIFYGSIKDYCILGLLPSYLERKHSSLVYMVQDMIQQSAHPDSGFFLYDFESLHQTLVKQSIKKQKTILIGTSFALLGFVEKYSVAFQELIVMETGGMKGHRKELVREELHQALAAGFGVNVIHSEYGMTELFSQAYALKQGIFTGPPWMKVYIRAINDPMTLLSNGSVGGINVIDLANINSCSFIVTQDIGKVHQDGGFEVLGRFDYSDIRGCNFLTA